MVSINMKSLINTLNATCRKSLEGAAGLCLSRTHYNVEIEHWLAKLLETPDADVAIILKYFDINTERFATDLSYSLDKLRTGNAKAPALSPDVIDLARGAWMLASLEYRAHHVRSGHLLLALLVDDKLARVARDISAEFSKISLETLQEKFVTILEHSIESTTELRQNLDGNSSNMPIAGGSAGNEALNQFTVDLTERARKGDLDPVLGRDNEIRQIMDILLRRRQNNPILTGEAGVGKTAVVEGFALRIVKGDVPPALKNISVRILDLALLQAGAGVKGEFENRLNSVIKAVKSSPQPIVLFIDEAHTMIGAGGSEGQGDAANLLKPALARGELRTIAATTWAEYKKYFEKDAALARRFQVVKIEEPNEKTAIEMMRGIANDMEKHHKVRILDEAIVASVKLSKRYIQGRQLPDKSVSLLDTACAKVALARNATPASVEDLQNQLVQTQVELKRLQREKVTGAKHDEQIVHLEAKLAKLQPELANLQTRFEAEKRLVTRIRHIKHRIEKLHHEAQPGEATPANFFDETDDLEVTKDIAFEKLKTIEQLLVALRKEESELLSLQGEAPLLQVCVDAQAVASVVASWTGIPVGRMVSDEINSVLGLKNKLAERVIGQDHALEAIAETIHVSRAGLGDPRKPIGVFMLAGTSGTGKTETALALADLLYGGEQNMTVINMSEFKEEHKVSMLVGSPPGYVGYGEGGVLTNAVRRRPYSVILLDEMEKAHPGVQDIFYQVFDKGMIMDGEGREVDFKNCVIIMTTNAGTKSIMEAYGGEPDKAPSTSKELAERIRPEMLRTFKPAFLGRINVVPYIPLDEEVLQEIVKLQLKKVARRIDEHYKANFAYGDDLVKTIAERCTEVETGARNVEHIISGTLLPELAAEFLSRLAEQKAIKTVTVKVSKQGEFKYKIV